LHFLFGREAAEPSGITIVFSMYRLLATGLLLAGLLKAQMPSPEALLQQAVEMQQRGDLDQAVKAYEDFLSLRPNETAVRSNLGVLLSRLGRFDEAIAEYKKAHDLDPSNAGIVLNLGLAYYKSGRIPEAAGEFSKAKAMAPDNLQITLLLADCELRMGQNANVIALLHPVEQQNPDNLAIAYMLGAAMIRDNQIQEGQKRVDRILRNGDSAEAQFLLGSQMFAAGDFPASVKQFAAAIDLNPNLPGLQSFYGQALLYTGDPDGAAAAFQKELAADPNDFEANLKLSEILTARQEWTGAEPLVARALRVRPNSADALRQMAEIDVAKGNLPEARRQLQVAEKASPQSASVHRLLSQVYAKLSLKSDAVREDKLATALEPKQAEGHGPRVGEQAPEFSAIQMRSGQAMTLARLRNHGPVLLVFGSYTCPNFRRAADSLNRLYAEYKGRIPFYLIYIREAHSTDKWQSTRNEREGIALPAATTMDEQHDHAALCLRKLHIAYPTLLDGMNGSAEKAYAAWPSRAYLVDRHGRVVFSSGLSELDFKPDQLEAAIRKESAPANASLSHRGARQ
jgi:tetratricopeptide (TPR) repeat protein